MLIHFLDSVRINISEKYYVYRTYSTEDVVILFRKVNLWEQNL